MRYLKISISLVLSVVGLLIYFITIPRIDGDDLVQLTVLAGDDHSIVDYSFNGYIHNFSSFSLTEDDLLVTGTLPFLEKLDATENMDLMMLTEDYPDFVYPLMYGPNIQSYAVSSDRDYLTSAHFEYQNSSYSDIYSRLYLRALKKETNEIIEDEITRNAGSNVYYASIYGVYENYPEISLLLETRAGGPRDNYDRDNGTYSLVSYNFETKNMTEEILLETQDYLETTLYSMVHKNQLRQVFYSIDSITEEPRTYIMNYETGQLTELETANTGLFVSDDNRLYHIADDTLVEIDEEGTVVNEVDLSEDYKELKNIDFESSIHYIYADKLFVLSNDYSDDYDENLPIKPTDLAIFNVSTGDLITEAQFTYGETNQMGARNVNIESISKRPSKD